MEKFEIETRGTDEFIVSLTDCFMLKVIPPEARKAHQYTPCKEVGVLLEEDLEDRPDYWGFGTVAAFEKADRAFCLNLQRKQYDFEGIGVLFADNDRADCNKELWWDAIAFYCSQRLGKTPAALTAYGYEYDYSVINGTSEMMRRLNGKPALDVN